MDSDDEDSSSKHKQTLNKIKFVLTIIPAPISHYGMQESRKRLQEVGFHPSVTLMTPQEIEREAIAYLNGQVEREPRKDFYESQKLRLGSKLFRKSHNKNGSKELGKGRDKGRDNDRGKGLDKRRIVLTQKRWDFTAAKYIIDPPSSVMVVMVPKYTVGDIRAAEKKYPLMVHPEDWNNERRRLEFEDHPDMYKIRSIEVEHVYFRWAKVWRETCQRATGPYWASECEEIDPRTDEGAIEWWKGNHRAINVMGSLKPLDEMWSANQLEGTSYKPHVMPYTLAMDSLLKLMFELFSARVHIRVLHLHDVPFLDRRVLAIILRGLPHVVMVGVYNCPLIHFGDVIPILDLIHEINIQRRDQNVPEIQDFDFFPYFNQGMPYEHENAATYGVSWSPLPMDIAQRGIYAIILKAVMKSKAMGIGLLFSPAHAFIKYLTKIPNTPLGMFGFLDAIYRYLEVKKDDPARSNLKLQAIYDLVKPIRLALNENLADDWPKYYTKQMAKTLLCCSSCGYETLEEFFPAGSKNRLPRHRRICGGCHLQLYLDEECDHWKMQKKRLIDKLCPDWNREAFNEDAPLFEDGAGLIRLKSTETERPLPQFLTFVVDGLLRVSPYYEPLMRDNKIQFDSLAGLPSLQDVAEDSETMQRWYSVVVLALREDVFRRGIHELRNQYRTGNKRKRIPAYGSTRMDGGAPDHQDELQPKKSDDGKKCFYDQKAALKAAQWMVKRKW
ncbi:hypothetical protein ACSS6W_004810 [Trichoderma asperelloides]